MKKVLLLPMMLMGVALSFTSCGDNDDPGKDPDVVTYDFKNLPADSGRFRAHRGSHRQSNPIYLLEAPTS